MESLRIETERLVITTFDKSMAEIVHMNSLDEDNRSFVPDEVFETLDIAMETILYLMSCYGKKDSPLVYPVLLKNGDNIGYVQVVLYKTKWEVGYHVAKKYTGRGYGTEALQAFLPVLMDYLAIKEILGVCLKENIASQRVLEKCGFILTFSGLDSYQGEDRELHKYLYSKEGIE